MTSLVSTLYVPRLQLNFFVMSLSLVAYGDSDSDSEDSLTPASQKETGQDVRKLLSLLPPVKTTQGSKGRVRIGLPKVAKGVS